MNIRLSFIILIFILVSCGQTNTSDNVTVLLNQPESDGFRYGKMKTWEPNQSETNLAEKIISQVIKENNIGHVDTKISVDINDYYYQLVTYLGNNNQKIIYANSLCKSFVQNPVPSLNGTNEKKEIN